MRPSPDLFTLLCWVFYVILNAYVLGLWIYALIRTRLAFWYIFIVTGTLTLIASVIGTALYADPYVGVRLLGLPGWKMFYYMFVAIQPVTALISAVGMTLLVMWVRRKV